MKSDPPNIPPYAPQMVSGEKGKRITLDPQVLSPGNVTSLSGATVTMVAVAPNGHSRYTFTMIVASNGATAYYDTSHDGTDFVLVGEWTTQFIAAFDANHVYTSRGEKLEVLRRY